MPLKRLTKYYTMDCFSKCYVKKGVPAIFVKLLVYWYKHLTSAVIWNFALGECFKVLCGVRQGRGVLSPYLFAFYVNDIIEDVRKLGFGIYIGSVFLGCILYADDILLLSGSCTGLQQMVNVCVQYGTQCHTLPSILMQLRVNT